MNLINQSVEILEIPSVQDLKRIETAGRICYDSLDKITDDSYKQFLKTIVKAKHLSVIEHSLCMFKIITSRAMMAELTRHRLCSVSVRSQRYVNHENLEIIAPFGFASMTIVEQQLLVNLYSQAEHTYQKLLKHSSKQIARGVLPEDTATTITLTCNLRELFHIIKLRTAAGAHPQMRCLINSLKLQLPVFIQELYTIFAS